MVIWEFCTVTYLPFRNYFILYDYYLFHLSNVDDKREEAAIGRLEELPPNIVMTKSHPLNLRTVNISSPILKLLSNGTEEQRNELQNQHMTIETALRYLDLPSKVLNVDAVQPLADAANLFIILRFRDINKFEKEALSLPLSGIKIVLSSDLLQIASEDAVYDFALKWARRRTLSAACNRYVERAYKLRPVKALEFEAPHQQSVVYLDLKRDECDILFPAGKLYSQGFHFCGQELFLSAHCNIDQQGFQHCLGLFLGMQGEESEPLAVDYEFSVRLRPDNEFVSMYKESHTLNNGIVVGCRNLCDIGWTPFLNGDGLYFIDGVLHIRAEITVVRE
ncbi:hypothetical protein MTR67_037364 [Solanum verrucosum]|uniref:BACK domain-containing protein n=1 Tax=Solanum verrucosum TaxID=315347 RepID=A0AAF0UEL5_SOLVR|nr:hypothetical protein MTR67_037364 [Solanum verrucosum]